MHPNNAPFVEQAYFQWHGNSVHSDKVGIGRGQQKLWFAPGNVAISGVLEAAVVQGALRGRQGRGGGQRHCDWERARAGATTYLEPAHFRTLQGQAADVVNVVKAVGEEANDVKGWQRLGAEGLHNGHAVEKQQPKDL